MDNDNPTNTPSQKEDERRQESRFNTHLATVLEQGEYSVYTTVINLSEQGVGFLSAKPFKKGDIVNINFDYHGQVSEPIKLKVEVLSCYDVDLEYYIGGRISNKTTEFNNFYQDAIPNSE